MLFVSLNLNCFCTFWVSVFSDETDHFEMEGVSAAEFIISSHTNKETSDVALSVDKEDIKEGDKAENRNENCDTNVPETSEKTDENSDNDSVLSLDSESLLVNILDHLELTTSKDCLINQPSSKVTSMIEEFREMSERAYSVKNEGSTESESSLVDKYCDTETKLDEISVTVEELQKKLSVQNVFGSSVDDPVLMWRVANQGDEDIPNLELPNEQFDGNNHLNGHYRLESFPPEEEKLTVKDQNDVVVSDENDPDLDVQNGDQNDVGVKNSEAGQSIAKVTKMSNQDRTKTEKISETVISDSCTQAFLDTTEEVAKQVNSEQHSSCKGNSLDSASNSPGNLIKCQKSKETGDKCQACVSDNTRPYDSASLDAANTESTFAGQQDVVQGNISSSAHGWPILQTEPQVEDWPSHVYQSPPRNSAQSKIATLKNIIGSKSLEGSGPKPGTSHYVPLEELDYWYDKGYQSLDTLTGGDNSVESDDLDLIPVNCVNYVQNMEKSDEFEYCEGNLVVDHKESVLASRSNTSSLNVNSANNIDTSQHEPELDSKSSSLLSVDSVSDNSVTSQQKSPPVEHSIKSESPIDHVSKGSSAEYSSNLVKIIAKGQTDGKSHLTHEEQIARTSKTSVNTDAQSQSAQDSTKTYSFENFCSDCNRNAKSDISDTEDNENSNLTHHLKDRKHYMEIESPFGKDDASTKVLYIEDNSYIEQSDSDVIIESEYED